MRKEIHKEVATFTLDALKKKETRFSARIGELVDAPVTYIKFHFETSTEASSICITHPTIPE